jgi:hypothetical protein
MNKKSLIAAQAADTAMAYSDYEGSARKVKITNTAATRTVHERYYGSHQATAIEIEFVEGNQAGTRKVVQSQKLVSTWAEWVTLQNLRADQQVTKEARLVQSKTDAEKAATAVRERFLAATGTEVRYGQVEVESNAYSHGSQYRPATSYSVKVSSAVLLAVLGA